MTNTTSTTTERRSAGERPRIVAMTAIAAHGGREMFLAAGMDEYLTRSIRVDALVGALLRAGVRQGP